MADSLLSGAAPEDSTLADPTPNDPTPTPTEFTGSVNLSELLEEDGNTFKKDLDFSKHFGDHAGHVQKYKTVGEFVRGVGNLSKLATGKSVGLVPPGEDATPEQVAEWRKGLGVPESPDGYGIKPPEKLPEGVEWDEKTTGKYLEVLHKHHAPPGLVKDLIEANLNIEGSRMEGSLNESRQQMEAEKSKLEDEFGVGTSSVLGKAARAALAIGLDPENNPLFGTAENVKAFAKLADMVGEDNLPNNLRDQKQTAYEESMKIMNDKSHPLYQRYYDGDPEVSRKVQQGLRHAIR